MKLSGTLIRRIFLLISPLLLATTMGTCLVLQFGGIYVVFCIDPPPATFNAYGNGYFDIYGNWRSIIYVGDDGAIYYSSAGTTCEWDSSETVPGEPNLNAITLKWIGVVNNMIVGNIIVGDNGIIYQKREFDSTGVFKINPAGTKDLNAICQDFLDQYTLNSPNVIAVGDSGTVIKSTNYGLTWNVINFPYSDNLRTCHIRGDYIVVGGENYSSFQSYDCGETWEQIGLGDNFNAVGPTSFNSIFFYDENVGYIGGPWGLMGKTTDGGTNWEAFGVQDFEEIYDLYFISPDSGVAVGSPGIVRFTSDGGNNWDEDTMVTNLLGGKTIKQIGVSEELIGMAMGEDGLDMIFSTDSTLLSVDENGNHIHNYSLSNNYPNPFNPSTIIEYYLPQYGFVTLKVYDMLGREIVTLVNEEKAAGNHKFEFNAGDLASGIYYYQIKVGNEFVETRKMVLLK